jgi:hypothetical protein
MRSLIPDKTTITTLQHYNITTLQHYHFREADC